MKTKSIALYLLDQVLSIIGVAVILFWSAGRIGWWAAWAAIAVWLIMFASMDIVIFRSNPDLLNERLAPPGGVKGWDRALMSSLRLIQLLRYLLGGLDQRYGWTAGFPASAQVVAMVVCLLATALFIWALASNKFFSALVRIQAERGQVVAAGGPYRFVRHPGYLGMVFFELSLSILFASWWSLLAGGACACLFILRTALEDRTLQAELPGYPDYARRVRYRLLPGLW
jgi:protein-S-isoprenylcysteine O-methyltransferase Ste14